MKKCLTASDIRKQIDKLLCTSCTDDKNCTCARCSKRALYRKLIAKEQLIAVKHFILLNTEIERGWYVQKLKKAAG